MIIDDQKTASSQSQSGTSRQNSTASDPFESPTLVTSPASIASPATTAYLHPSAGNSQEIVAEGSAPPIYSPRERPANPDRRHGRTLIATNADLSTHDLPSGSPNYPAEKIQLPDYNELPLAADAAVQDDGRIQVLFAQRRSGELPGYYGAPVREVGIDEEGFVDAPRMSINIMIVGSRGDVQPYIALGQRLQDYGHAIRLSTHEIFRSMVQKAGLRFFNIGGDPHELMGYMVRNPGLVPGLDSLKNGDVGKNQHMIAQILERCLLSCFAQDEQSEGEPGFAADCIISNPPTFAHIHCAELLGIPLHMSFTMPWSATAAFPHPLVNLKQSEETEPKMANYYSYTLVDMMTWQGLGRTINKFRMKRLGLEYLSTQSAIGMLERCGIPWTYCLSPTLIPKPEDWMSHIDVVGFSFLNLAKGYEPPSDLVEFLEAGEAPIYVGFGSIVLEDPQKMTKSVLGAIAQAGVRALISPGWGGLDEGMIRSAGENVFAVDNVPHDWLFERVSAVCYHGGAGTTAIGLKCGKPTIVIPFFGDQPWWAAQISRRGAGPPPIHPNKLSAEALASAIRVALSPETQEAAKKVGELVRQEDGANNAVESIHKHLPLLNMRCDLAPNQVAVWYSPTHKLRLSALAAQVLAEAGELDINKLELHRSREYDIHVGPIDPVSGTLPPVIKSLENFGRGVAQLPTQPGKGGKKMLAAGTLGLQNTLAGAAEGMHNLPKVYGGEVRKHKKVTGLGSGLVLGGKEFALGLYDGFSDFFMEPVRGFKRGGVLGAIGGVGIGALNLTAKPAAGFMHAVSMPIEGGVKDVRSLFHRQAGKERVATRYAEGVTAARAAPEKHREAIIRAFVDHVSLVGSDKKGKGKGKEKAM